VGNIEHIHRSEQRSSRVEGQARLDKSFFPRPLALEHVKIIGSAAGLPAVYPAYCGNVHISAVALFTAVAYATLPWIERRFPCLLVLVGNLFFMFVVHVPASLCSQALAAWLYQLIRLF
jgi:hypothetical protein